MAIDASIEQLTAMRKIESYKQCVRGARSLLIVTRTGEAIRVGHEVQQKLLQIRKDAIGRRRAHTRKGWCKGAHARTGGEIGANVLSR